MSKVTINHVEAEQYRYRREEISKQTNEDSSARVTEDSCSSRHRFDAVEPNHERKERDILARSVELDTVEVDLYYTVSDKRRSIARVILLTLNLDVRDGQTTQMMHNVEAHIPMIKVRLKLAQYVPSFRHRVISIGGVCSGYGVVGGLRERRRVEGECRAGDDQPRVGLQGMSISIREARKNRDHGP